MSKLLQPYPLGKEEKDSWFEDLYRFLNERGVAAFVPIGGVIVRPTGLTFPAGYLLCDGSSIDSPLYADLAEELGATTLPDYSGETLNGISVDYYIRY